MKSKIKVLMVLVGLVLSDQYLKKQNQTVEDKDIIDIQTNDENSQIGQGESLNSQPIIGVLTQPSSWPKIYNETEYSYIASSYIKFLESSGAQVVPIKYDQDQVQLKKIFKSINGLFLPGGGSDLLKSQTYFKIQQKKLKEAQKEREQKKKNNTDAFSFKEQLPTSLREKEEEEDESTDLKSNEENGGQNEEIFKIDELSKIQMNQTLTEDNIHTTKKYKDEMTYLAKQGQYLLNLAIEANDQGDFFPVWGTCLGFELLLLATANDCQALNIVNSTNHSLRMKLNHVQSSKLMGEMSERMKAYLSFEKAMYFNHRYGTTNETFYSFPNLYNFWEPLSYNHDKNGKVFVSMIEAKKYPFYGVQFHPEKNSFEWKDNLEINHEMGSIELGHYFGNFFVNEARKNNHQVQPDFDMKRELIYNYYPILVSDSFMGIYMFNKLGQQQDSYMANIIKPMTFIENTNITSNKTESDKQSEKKESKSVRFQQSSKEKEEKSNEKVFIKSMFQDIQKRLQDALGISKNIDKLFKRNVVK